jgi:hypothetical protein
VQGDTIKAYGGNPKYHWALYCNHVDTYAKKKGYGMNEELKTLKGEKLNKMKSKALKSRSGAYFGCLFLMMADKRYKPFRRFLCKAFLAEKQQYPLNMLAMKRFMAGFIGTDADKPKRQ